MDDASSLPGPYSGALSYPAQIWLLMPFGSRVSVWAKRLGSSTAGRGGAGEPDHLLAACGCCSSAGQGFPGDYLPLWHQPEQWLFRDLTELNMPRKPKSWDAKRQAKPPHMVCLDKDFAGVPAGSKLLISSPMELEDYLCQHLPAGSTMSIQQVRRELAALHGADATCPVSTAIFLRAVAEAAWERIGAGAAVADVPPFWRVIEPQSPLGKKLACGPDWLAQQRAAEADVRESS